MTTNNSPILIKHRQKMSRKDINSLIWLFILAVVAIGLSVAALMRPYV